MKGAVLGIDFGTTNTAAAFVDERGEVQVVPVSDRALILPSAVCFHRDGSVLVGQSAKELIVDDPQHTILGVKRFLGRRFLSDFVGRNRGRVVYRLIEGEDGLSAVELFGEVIPLDEVAYQIIRRIVELAEISLGAPFEACVIAVPAHYTYRQRQVIRSVAERVLPVQAMLNEPVAAALHYANLGGDEENVLVCDVGGGTFDATFMKLHDGIVEVLATGGDAFLGGNDFDRAIVDFLVEEFQFLHNVDLSDDVIAQQRLFIAAEKAKIELTTHERVLIEVPSVTVDNDKFIDLSIELSRRRIAELVAPLIERLLGIAEDVVRRATGAPEKVSELVLVGGQTRMPAVRNRLARAFPMKPRQIVDPELAIAIGAALYANGKHALVDVLSVPIGVMLPQGRPLEAVPRNTSLPCVRRVPLEKRPREGRDGAIVFFEAVDVASIDRDVVATAPIPAAWLAQNPGDLALEVRLSTNFDLTARLHASKGGHIKLEITGGYQPSATSAPPRVEPSSENSPLLRANDRLSVDIKARLRAHGSELSTTVAVKDLSAGGARVVGTIDLRLGSFVELVLPGETPVSLSGEVVRRETIAGVWNLGIRFSQLPSNSVIGLKYFMEQNANANQDDQTEILAEEQRAEQTSDEQRRLVHFLTSVRNKDVYGALGVPPLTDDSTVLESIKRVEIDIERIRAATDDAGRAKFDGARKVLERVRAIFVDPRQRLFHDFRNNLLFVDERKKRLESAPEDLTLVREVWNQCFPANVDEAATHMASALRAVKQRDYDTAIAAADRATALLPFDRELQRTRASWREKRDRAIL